MGKDVAGEEIRSTQRAAQDCTALCEGRTF